MFFSNSSLFAHATFTAVANDSSGGEVDDGIRETLKVVLPLLCGISIPASYLNLFLLLHAGIFSLPSNVIYFNMILLDLINCYLGLEILINGFDMEKSWTKFNVTLYSFSIDSYIVLILGLTLLRFFCIKISTLSVRNNLHKVSRATVLAAQGWGATVILIWHERHNLSHTAAWIYFCDAVELGMVLITIVLAIYTWLRARYMFLRTHNFRSTSHICLLLVLNYTVSCYSYYTIVDVVKIYFKVSRREPSRFDRVLFFSAANVRVLGITFMCLQALILNLILLSQGHSRIALKKCVATCWTEMKEKIENARHDSVYSYIY